MNWEQFNYLCRAYAHSNKVKPMSFAEFRQRPELKNTLSHFEPAKPSKRRNYPLTKIIERMDSDASADLPAAKLYAQTNFASSFRKTSNLLKLRLYFGLLALVFIIMSTMFSVFIYPTLADAFETIGAGHIAQTDAFVSMLPWISLVLVLLLISCFVFAHKLSRAAGGELDFEELSRRFWASKNLKRTYAEIHLILNYPLEFQDKENTTNQISEIIGYSDNLKVIGDELRILFQIKCQFMHQESERIIRWLVGLTGILIAISIFFFASSAYAPIFKMASVL